MTEQMKRPNKFQVKLPDLGWVMIVEGQTDIPSILDKVWKIAKDKGYPIKIIEE